MSADIYSAPTILQSVSGVSYSLSWTGSTPVGTAALQVSNDYSLNPDGTVKNSGTWNTRYTLVAGSLAANVAISGNTGNAYLELEKTNAYAVRLFYDAGSGTGTLNAIINGKVS
jgi:hypothetical protein